MIPSDGHISHGALEHTYMDKGTRGTPRDNEFMIGWKVKCHKCGDVLPLLHPHIIVERYDEYENIICEECYEKLRSET
jgi:hypothetical protein